MTTHLNVAIVGYGTAGQALAILLSRDGHKVEVFERAPEPGPVGAGFLLQPTGLQVLWQMGLLPAALRHGAPVCRLYGETPSGRGVMDMRYEGLDRRLYGLGMQRGALFSLLADAWEGVAGLHRGTRVTSADHDTGRLTDEHGRVHGPFDLIIAADGSGSQLRQHVRQQASPSRTDRVYPWGALWCLVPSGDWPWTDELRQRYVAARKMIGLLPVGTRPGDDVPRLSFFWSLPRSDFDAWQSRGMTAWREEVAGIWPQASARLESVTECSQLARATYRDTAHNQWHRGRVVLAGDAAHSMSPQLGQGVNMALMDAMALRDALRSESRLDDALAQYQRVRRRHVSIYHFWSHWLTPLFQSDRDLIARIRDASFLPLGKTPGGRGHMLRILSGTQQGWWGKLALQPGFVQALAGHRPVAQEQEAGRSDIGRKRN
jgi:2-polyprenyl-6-methoxyphenol hydroxylase-like FAD-dependent oxidoreductase